MGLHVHVSGLQAASRNAWLCSYSSAHQPMCAAFRTGCTADMQDMHEALVLMCSRALAGAGRDKPRQAQVMLSVQQDARLLPWYAEELLRNVRGEILSAAQVGRAPFFMRT